MFQLIQTEKASNLQTQHVYVLGLTANPSATVNKIVLTKALNQLKIEVLEINSQNSYSKNKKKGKKFMMVKQVRPKKFYVKLAPTKTIDEDTLALINQKIFTPITLTK